MKSRRRCRDIAEEITAEILAKLDEGVLPWRCDWRKSEAGLPRRHCGERYRGINQLFLGMRAHARGYSSPYWMTARQARELGGCVKKGEKASVSIFYGTGRRNDDSEDDECRPAYRFLRYNNVFNVAQIADLPDEFHVAEQALDAGGRPIERLDAFFARMRLPVNIGGDIAAYRPVPDDIAMPPHERFADDEMWYATLAHEGAHYAGGAGRLNRETTIRYNESLKIRGEEELIAELSAAMLGAQLRLSAHHIDSHASYIDGWIKTMKADKRLFLKAAAAAQESVDWMLRAAGVPEGADPPEAAGPADVASLATDCPTLCTTG